MGLLFWTDFLCPIWTWKMFKIYFYLLFHLIVCIPSSIFHCIHLQRKAVLLAAVDNWFQLPCHEENLIELYNVLYAMIKCFRNAWHRNFLFEIWTNSIILRIRAKLLNWNYNCVKLQKQVYDEWFISTFLLLSSRFELDLGVEKGQKGNLIK